MSDGAIANGASVPSTQTGKTQDVITTSTTVTASAVSGETMGATGASSVSFSDVFERDALIATIAITTAASAGGALLGANTDPFNAFVELPFIAEKLKGYTGISGDLEVTFRPTIPGSCSGLLVCSATCQGGLNPWSTPSLELGRNTTWNMHNACQDTFGLLNMELANTVKLTLPWVSHRTYHKLDDSDGPRCWDIQVHTMAPLDSCLSAAAVTGRLQIFARLLPGYKLYNLQLESKPHPTQFPTRGKGAVSGGLRSASNLMSSPLVSSLVGPLAMPAAAGLAVASSLAELMGFTREAAPVQPTPTVRRLFSNLGQVDGLDTSETTGLFAGNAVSIDQRIGGGSEDDPMSFKSLFQRWTMLETFTISNVTAAGTTVRIHPVTPCFTTASNPYTMSPAGFVALPFAQWRGSMEYMIYVASGSTVRGNLVVAWEPIVDSTRTFVADPTNRVNSVSIDLCGSTATHLSIAPSTEYTTLETHYIPVTAKTNATKTNSNGQLVFYLQTEVTVPKTTPYVVNVFIFERAKEDMRFGVPRSVIKVTNTTAYLTKDVFFEADVAGRITDELVTHTDVDLIPTGQEYSPALVQWGEEFLSVRPLMQRFGCLGTGRVKTGDVGLMLPHYIRPPTEGVTNTDTWTNFTQGGAYATDVSCRVPFTWAGFYSMLFVGVRGSTRVKYMLDEPVANTHPFAAANASTTNDALTIATLGMDLEVATGWPGMMIANMQMPTTENGLEITFPAYLTSKFWCPRWSPTTNLGAAYGTSEFSYQYDSIFPVSRRALPSFFGWTIFTAYGSDVSANRFRRVPSVHVGRQA